MSEVRTGENSPGNFVTSVLTERYKEVLAFWLVCLIVCMHFCIIYVTLARFSTQSPQYYMSGEGIRTGSAFVLYLCLFVRLFMCILNVKFKTFLLWQPLLFIILCYKYVINYRNDSPN